LISTVATSYLLGVSTRRVDKQVGKSCRDRHAVPGRRGQVDRRVAETGCHQQPQAGESAEQALGKGRSLAHDHDDFVGVQHLRQLRFVRDVLAQRANCDAVTDGRPVRECGRPTLEVIQDRAAQHLGHLSVNL
jgi:hypothetical protein